MIDPSILYTGGLIALAGSLAFSVRNIPIQLWNKFKSRIIYTVKVYQTDLLFDLLETYMFNNYSNSYRDVEAVISYSSQAPVTPRVRDDVPHIAQKYLLQYKQEDTIFIIRIGGKKILVNKGKEKLDSATNIRDLYYRHYNISGLFAKKQINGLLEQIVSDYNKTLHTSINVYINDCYGNWMHGNELHVKPFDQVIIDEEIKERIKLDLDEFANGKDWYIERNIPYKRTYCLHGPPGNGKTTMALSIARYLSKNVYMMSLNSLDKDDSMLRAFGSIPKNSLILMEDIDSAFNLREAVNNTRISFSALLNCMDGALYKEGSLCILTTNHLSKLDPALIRAGRTDVVQEISKPSQPLISRYVSMFFNTQAPREGYIDDLSMSEVQEVCIQNKNDYPQAIKQLTY